MMKNLRITLAFIFFGIFSCGAETEEKEKRPNILFIMSDDHSVNSISAYGENHLTKLVKTPNIDRLAKEGARLDACFVTNSICSPSRACILTGKYSHINGMRGFSPPFRGEQENVAKILKKNGYQTAIIGKWHLYSEPTGFDYWNVLPGQGKYDNPAYIEIGTTKGKNFEKVKGVRHSGREPEVLLKLTKEWLQEKRDKTKPFFLMCHFKAPHEPWDYSPKYADLIKDVTVPYPASYNDSEEDRSPGSKNMGFRLKDLAAWMKKAWPTGPLEVKSDDPKEIQAAVYQKYVKEYLRCVAELDDNIGNLLQYLDESGLSENTVVIYTSDQGMFLGEHQLADKRWMFEESLRMPFMVRYPKEIKAGSVNNDMIINVDFAPTFLDFASVEVPSDMQGRSFRNNLKGQTPGDWRQSIYYRYWLHTQAKSKQAESASEPYPAHYGVRDKKHKLIFFYGLPLDAGDGDPTPAGWELYDLEKDPYEMHNVYNDPAYADVVMSMKKELLRLKKELKDEDEEYPELLELRQKTGGI